MPHAPHAHAPHPTRVDEVQLLYRQWNDAEEPQPNDSHGANEGQGAINVRPMHLGGSTSGSGASAAASTTAAVLPASACGLAMQQQHPLVQLNTRSSLLGLDLSSLLRPGRAVGSTLALWPATGGAAWQPQAAPAAVHAAVPVSYTALLGEDAMDLAAVAAAPAQAAVPAAAAALALAAGGTATAGAAGQGSSSGGAASRAAKRKMPGAGGTQPAAVKPCKRTKGTSATSSCAGAVAAAQPSAPASPLASPPTFEQVLRSKVMEGATEVYDISACPRVKTKRGKKAVGDAPAGAHVDPVCLWAGSDVLLLLLHGSSPCMHAHTLATAPNRYPIAAKPCACSHTQPPTHPLADRLTTHSPMHAPTHLPCCQWWGSLRC